ncbi:MAG: hypothetical protein P4L70_12585 [Parasulfuritortus sp.]|jgi:hypothetical protein|nr:hypothetical protein [Parasulfuritortus sp.]
MDVRLPTNTMTAGDARSLLELHYPHIVEGLLKVWNNPEATEHYLNSILVDDRDDRQGLPVEVFADLMYLSDLNWKRTHFNTDGVQTTATGFSFSGL